MSLNLLALDTSHQCCSVALLQQSQVSELHERAEQKHSEVVLPMIRRILDEAGLALNDLNAFVVGNGPGGFTGVRLAVATIQGLAFALNKPVIVFSSLLAMAYAAYRKNGTESVVNVAMDARMQEIYHAIYRISDNGFITLQEPSLSTITDFMAAQHAYAKFPEYAVVGNAINAFEPVKQWVIQNTNGILDIDHEAPHAADLMLAAQKFFEQGQVCSPEMVAPLYVRDKIALTIDERVAQGRRS